jgi:hypothetical protein
MLTNQREASQVVSEKTSNRGGLARPVLRRATIWGSGNSRKLQLTISAITDDDIAGMPYGVISRPSTNKDQEYVFKPSQAETEGLLID